MISKKMEAALNGQINAETYSAYLYLSMAAYFESVNLPGFAHWMKVQTQEEMVHALKFYNFIQDRGGKVALAAIAAPKTEWKSAADAFGDAYKHEQKVTAMINGLVELAQKEKDKAADTFLQWFVTEQVEEEKSPYDILQQLKMAGNNPSALLMLDRELGARIFTLPPDMVEWAPGGAAGAGA
jgi:ferritin